MEKIDQITFSAQDFQEFRSWIKLNMESITWQGRFKDQFEEFWEVFFEEGLSLSEVISRFKYAGSVLKLGPLIAWFNWLKNKFICYCFIEKGLSILDLARLSSQNPSHIAIILRSYFVDLAPQNEEYFSEVFQVGNLASQNLELTFDDILEKVTFDNYDISDYIEEIMPSLEVTLYEDWNTFTKRMKKDFGEKSGDLSKAHRRDRLYSKIKVLRDAVILLASAIAIIWVVTYVNKKYEDYLADKISVYEPQFKWLNKSLVFKPVENVVPSEDFKLDISDIENVEKFDQVLGESLDDVERTEVESEVVLTSWDSLPKDINIADLEQSDYEEVKKRGYRDSRYGNTKVYRVMMRSSNSSEAKKELALLLDKYKVTQVDNVKPGLDVPGGLYYNLYVPRTHLKEFMAQVQEIDEAVIYESRTITRRNPPGKNKVFIWIKKI